MAVSTPVPQSDSGKLTCVLLKEVAGSDQVLAVLNAGDAGVEVCSCHLKLCKVREECGLLKEFSERFTEFHMGVGIAGGGGVCGVPGAAPRARCLPSPRGSAWQGLPEAFHLIQSYKNFFFFNLDCSGSSCHFPLWDSKCSRCLKELVAVTPQWSRGVDLGAPRTERKEGSKAGRVSFFVVSWFSPTFLLTGFSRQLSTSKT